MRPVASRRSSTSSRRDPLRSSRRGSSKRQARHESPPSPEVSESEPVDRLQSLLGNRTLAAAVRSVAVGPAAATDAPPMASRMVHREPDPAGKRAKAPTDESPPTATSGPGWRRLSNGVIITDIERFLHAAPPKLKRGPSVAVWLKDKLPHIASALSGEQIAQWQLAVDRQLAITDAQRWVDEAIRERRLADGTFLDWKQRLEKSLPPPGPPTVDLDIARLLDPGILEVTADIQAELAFRKGAIARLTSGSWKLPTMRPDDQVGTLPIPGRNTGGRITADTLQSMYPDEYSRQVSNRTEVKQLAALGSELQNVVNELYPMHQDRSNMNAKYSGVKGIVRHTSEALGSGSAPYPSLKLWRKPRAQLEAGMKALAGRQIEMAVMYLAQADAGIRSVAEKAQNYEDRVTSGAEVAVKWLERTKTAGSIAAGIAAGPLGWEGAALAGGAYAFGSDILQQASGVHFGTQESIDVGQAVKKGTVAMLSGAVGGVIQGKFKDALLLRFAPSGTPDIVDKYVTGVLSTATSTVYTAPMEMVLRSVIEGEKFPADLSEFCDMVVQQTLEATLTEGLVTGPIGIAIEHAHANNGKGAGADPKAPAGPEAQKRPTMAIAELDALGASLTAKGSPHANADGPAGAGGHGPGVPDGPVPSKSQGSAEAQSRPANDTASGGDPRFETGLQSPKAVKDVAGQADAWLNRPEAPAPNGNAMDSIELAEHGAKVLDMVAQHLPKGMPKPSVVTRDLKNPAVLGHYDAKTNSIVLNSKAGVDAQGRPAYPGDATGFRRILALVYHESRHAEQAYQALRVRAGRSPGEKSAVVEAEILDETGVHKSLAEAAAKDPIGTTDSSVEAALGRETWDEVYQPGPRRNLRNWAQSFDATPSLRRIAGLETAIQSLDAMLGAMQNDTSAANMYKPNRQSMELNLEAATHAKTVGDIRSDLRTAFDMYSNLAEEIDARRTQYKIEDSFDTLLQARLRMNKANDGLNRMSDVLDHMKVSTGNVDDVTSQLIRVVKMEREWHDALDRWVSLTNPKA